MRCLQEADLMRFVDGSLPDAAHEAVQRHVQGCVQCAGALRRLTDTRDRIDACLAALAPEDARPTDAPESLARLRNRIHERPAASRRWALVWAAGVAPACIVAIALGIAGHPSKTTSRGKQDMQAASDGQPQATADYLPLDSGVPMQMGVVVRVTLPASAFARFGVAGSGNLQADVLVGEDGIAHAIRLVRRE